jgi:hypothetical protein
MDQITQFYNTIAIRKPDVYNNNRKLGELMHSIELFRKYLMYFCCEHSLKLRVIDEFAN